MRGLAPGGEWTNGWSKSITGDLLWGDQAVRFIFMDEAGVSALEPVTVVTAVIADADHHLMAAEARVAEILGSVPPQHREGFVFSAKTIFNSPKYKSDWPMSSRLELLDAMMSVPRQLNMGFAVSAKWRNAPMSQIEGIPLKPEQLDHLAAFVTCVGLIDKTMRKNAGSREVATIVAEDHIEMRQFLKLVPIALRNDPMFYGEEMVRLTERDKSRGYIDQTMELRVTRIRNVVHFVEKADDPLVQVADACAYGLRRYFANQSFGERFAKSVMGRLSALSDFRSPGGAECSWGSASAS